MKDLLVMHGYLEAKLEELYQIEPDDDDIMEVNVGNEEIHNGVFSYGGGCFTNIRNC